jgi:hypothetical protein
LTYPKKHGPVATRGVARRAKRTVVGSLVAVALISTPVGVASAAPLSSSLALPASPSAAGAAAGSTRSEVAALRGEITTEARRIHDLTAAYSQAASEASVLSGQLVTQRHSLVSLRRDLGGAQRALRRAAIESYTGTDMNEDATDVKGSTQAAIGTEFLTVASGDVSNLEDGYKVAQSRVSSAISRLTSEQRANTKALTDAATARSEALKTATGEQGQLSSLEDKLAALEQADAQGGPSNNGLVKSTETQTGSSSAPPTTTTPSSTSPSTNTPPTTGSPTTDAPTTAPPTTGPRSTTPTTDPPTTTPPTTSPPTTAPPSGGGGNAGGVWLELRQCESGDNYQENTGNGFYGAYQFSATTWTGLGYPGRPDLESPAMQDAAAMKLQAEAGWGQWPACSAALGL